MIRLDVISRSRNGLGWSDWGGCLSDWCSFGPLGHPAQTLLLGRCGLRVSQEIGHAQQRVAANSERGHEADFQLAHHLHLAQRSAVLAPAKALLDTLAQPLAGKVPAMPRGARVDRRATLLGDVHR